MNPPTETTYLTREEAMERLGYRNICTWYRAIRAGKIAGVVRRDGRFLYLRAELSYAGSFERVATLRDRDDEEREQRRLATKPAGGWRNPYLRSRFVMR